MILVTGATGFVGRRLVRKLAEIYPAREIVCLVHVNKDSQLEITGRDNLDNLGITYHEVELVSGKGLEYAPKRPSKIFHIAALTDTSIPDHSVNDIGTLNLLDAVGPLDEETHFLYTSTIAVSDNRHDTSLPCTETTDLLRPLSEYGRSKLRTEKLLREASDSQGFSLSMIRLSAVWGQGTRKGGFFDKAVGMAKSNSLLSLLNYPGKISYVYVNDIADILCQLAIHPPAPRVQEMYIPTDESLALQDLFQHIYAELDKPYKKLNLPHLVWSLGAAIAVSISKMDRWLPHRLTNFAWQMSLLATGGYDNKSEFLQHRLPLFTFTKLHQQIRELI